MMEYQNQFFQQIHRFFPALLYDDRFTNNELCQYIRQQVQYHEDPYHRNREHYVESQPVRGDRANIARRPQTRQNTSSTSPIHVSSNNTINNPPPSLTSIVSNATPTTQTQAPVESTIFSTFIPLYPTVRNNNTGVSTNQQNASSRVRSQPQNSTNLSRTATVPGGDTGIDVTISAAVQDLFSLVGQNMNSFDETLLQGLGLGLGGANGRGMNGFNEPVPVVPSQDVIERTCETMTYDEYITKMEEESEDTTDNDSDPSSTSIVHTECPIRQQSFSNDDTITRIKHCGHVFFEDELNIWFQTHPTCPVCRHDIREE